MKKSELRKIIREEIVRLKKSNNQLSEASKLKLYLQDDKIKNSFKKYGYYLDKKETIKIGGSVLKRVIKKNGRTGG
ncbi:MAG: hypothetical protein H8E13_12325 [Actinobacteria bacterium]|nr:hypothetical protein [Actinomycetota bacterium]